MLINLRTLLVVLSGDGFEMLGEILTPEQRERFDDYAADLVSRILYGLASAGRRAEVSRLMDIIEGLQPMAANRSTEIELLGLEDTDEPGNESSENTVSPQEALEEIERFLSDKGGVSVPDVEIVLWAQSVGIEGGIHRRLRALKEEGRVSFQVIPGVGSVWSIGKPETIIMPAKPPSPEVNVAPRRPRRRTDPMGLNPREQAVVDFIVDNPGYRTPVLAQKLVNNPVVNYSKLDHDRFLGVLTTLLGSSRIRRHITPRDAAGNLCGWKPVMEAPADQAVADQE